MRSRVDLDLARANLASAQLVATEAENAARIAVAKLGQALGDAQDGEYLLDPPEPTVPEVEPIAALVEEALRTRPELRSLDFQHQGAEERLEFTRSQKKPLLNLVFTGGYARFTNVLARELLATGAGLALPVHGREDRRPGGGSTGAGSTGAGSTGAATVARKPTRVAEAACLAGSPLRMGSN
jgi:outer membrane protein TolC